MFSRRTSWNLASNRYTRAVEAHRRAGKEFLDLTASNPTRVELDYPEEDLLRALSQPEALIYDPQPKGLLSARHAITGYYAGRGTRVAPDDMFLTTSTSEGYSFAFRLLCDPGDVVLVPTPSYPLFDFLADLQDVKLAPYELVYDHGWQIDFHSLQAAIERVHAEDGTCRAVMVVHPNNPTGSYVKAYEAQELNRICSTHAIALIADEVFLDYRLDAPHPMTFADNDGVLTFTLSGLSKICGLPQMKVAWIAVSGPPAVKENALGRLEVIADTYLSMNAPVQLAVPEMLARRIGIQRQLLERIQSNLAELDRQLASQKLCHRLEVAGGWYAVLRIPLLGSDEESVVSVLEQTGVLVQPGHFYDFPGDGHLILSLITPLGAFATGLGRLLQWVAQR